MLFCSQRFVLFFAVVFALYWTLPWRQIRVWLLLAASFYFYATWNPWLAGLVTLTTAIDYVIGRGLEAFVRPRPRRLLLLASLTMNLGLLAYFKYTNFFLRSLEDALRAAGVAASLPVLSIVLPLGISFYTFEAISYTVDVYRRRIAAERDFAHFLLFILFFPHLIAGPIVRARDFLPQVRRAKRWDWARLALGLQFFVTGLFKKMVIADRMALLADPVFADPAAYRAGALWAAAVAWTVQVYCDFSGYSDMALGCAHALGYKLTRNFNLPFLAPNIAELWRRWHISLSTWLRDYLYIPLGGSRQGRLRTARNLAVTMALCGLWHGANWPYVAFGVLQAGLMVLHRGFRAACERSALLPRVLGTAPGTAVRVALTFGTFCCALVIFRSPTVASGVAMLREMFTGRGGSATPAALTGFGWMAALVVVCHLAAVGDAWKKAAARLPAPVIGLGQAVALTLALLLTPGAGRPFVYFQF